MRASWLKTCSEAPSMIRVARWTVAWLLLVGLVALASATTQVTAIPKLELSAVPGKTTYRLGEDIDIHLSLTNVGSDPALVSNFLSGNYEVVALLCNGADVEPQIREVNFSADLASVLELSLEQLLPGNQISLVWTTVPGGDGIPVLMSILYDEKGHHHAAFYTLREPGEYLLRLAYEYKGPLATPSLREGRVEMAEPIRFTIVEDRISAPSVAGAPGRTPGRVQCDSATKTRIEGCVANDRSGEIQRLLSILDSSNYDHVIRIQSGIISGRTDQYRTALGLAWPATYDAWSKESGGTGLGCSSVIWVDAGACESWSASGYSGYSVCAVLAHELQHAVDDARGELDGRVDPDTLICPPKGTPGCESAQRCQGTQRCEVKAEATANKYRAQNGLPQDWAYGNPCTNGYLPTVAFAYPNDLVYTCVVQTPSSGSPAVEYPGCWIPWTDNLYSQSPAEIAQRPGNVKLTANKDGSIQVTTDAPPGTDVCVTQIWWTLQGEYVGWPQTNPSCISGDVSNPLWPSLPTWYTTPSEVAGGSASPKLIPLPNDVRFGYVQTKSGTRYVGVVEVPSWAPGALHYGEAYAVPLASSPVQTPPTEDPPFFGRSPARGEASVTLTPQGTDIAVALEVPDKDHEVWISWLAWTADGVRTGATVKQPVGPPTMGPGSAVAKTPNPLCLGLVKICPFTDEFADPGTGWPTAVDAAGGSGYQDGKYALWLNNPNVPWWVWAPFPRRCPEAFAVEVTAARRSGGDSAEYGILWGLGNGDLYVFLVRADGSYTVRWLRGNTWQNDPIPLTRSALVLRGTAANRLRVVVSGDRAAIEVNGANLGSIPLAMKGPYWVGLFIASGEAVPAKVRFTEFSVCVP